MRRGLDVTRHLPRWLPAAVVATGLLVAAVVRTAEGQQTTEPLGIGLDKYLHAVGYGLLAGTLAVALRRRPTAGAVALVVVVAVGYGAALELLQVPLPYRAFSLLDLAADAVGAMVAVAVWWALDRSGP